MVSKQRSASVARSRTPDPSSKTRNSSQHQMPVASICGSHPNIIAALLLVAAMVLSAIVHLELRRAEFVWDDRAAIKGNRDVRGETPLSSIWHHDFWGQKLASRTSHKSYRPLCVIAFRMNFWLSGFDASSYHVINVLLHTITTVSTFWLSQELTSIFTRPVTQHWLRPLAAGFTALLFAVHPVHVEAVAGLVSRADIMAALGMVLCIICYIRAKKANSVKHLIVALALALFASLSKETGATVVLLMLLLEIIPFEKSKSGLSTKDGSDLATKDGYCMMSICRVLAILCSTTAFFKVRVQMHGGHDLRKWQLMENHVALLPTTFLQRWLTIAHTHARYAQYALMPQRGMLAYDHGFNSTTTAIVSSVKDPRNLGTLAAYTLVIATFVFIAKLRSRFLLFAMMSALVPLAPALNVVFWVGTLLAERLLYIPSIGICLGLGYLLALPFEAHFVKNKVLDQVEDTIDSRRRCMILRGHACRTYAYCLVVGLVIGDMSMHSYTRSLDWLDEESIYESGYKSEPDSVKIINNYAQILLRSGKHEDAAQADKILQVSIDLAGGLYPSAIFNRALALGTIGNKSGAMLLFKQALTKYPVGDRSRANVHGYLAQELMEVHYSEKMKVPKSKSLDYSGTYTSDSDGYIALVEWHCLRAIAVGCKMPLVHFTLGNVYQETKRYDLALASYERALRMNDDPFLERGYGLKVNDVRNMMALSYQGRNTLCKKSSDMVNPDSSLRMTVPESYPGEVDISQPEFDSVFGMKDRIVVSSCQDSLEHDIHRAIQEYIKCTTADPKFFQALVNMGVLYEETGNSELAEEHYLRALSVNPNHELLLNNLAVVVLRRGKYRQALEYASRAYEITSTHDKIVLTYQRALEGAAKWLYEVGEDEVLASGTAVKRRKPLEALSMYFKIFEIGSAATRILDHMVKAFLSIESVAEQKEVGGALINIRDSIWRMSDELARQELSSEIFSLLSKAFETIGKFKEAAEVLAKGRNVFDEKHTPETGSEPLLSFLVEDKTFGPEGVQFNFYDGQVAEVTSYEFATKHHLQPVTSWTNRLAQAVRENLSEVDLKREAAHESNRGALLFVIPLQVAPGQEYNPADMMFCEKDQRDVWSFVKSFCVVYGGGTSTDQANCHKTLQDFISQKLGTQL